MKIYRNKLYCIRDAAKRAGVTEDQIKEMITYHIIKADEHYFTCFIWGEDIPGLKAKWAEWEAKKKKMGKAHLEKDPIKNTKVTILRMDKGE